MTKPSIFSKDYQKKMKRRKIIVGSTIVLIIAVGGLFVIKKFLTSNIKDKLSSQPNQEETLQADKEENAKNKEDASATPKEDNVTQDNVIEKKTVDGPAINGIQVKIHYDEINGEKTIVSLTGDGDYSYDISPDKKSLVIIDPKTQDMKLFDINKGEQNITKTNYKTKSGKNFDKDSVLKTYPNQIWNEQGKFIDDNTIAYISNLPYLGSGNLDKYIWILDLKSGTHKTLFNSKAKEISFKDSANGVLKVDINGQEKNLDATGRIY